MRRCLLALSRPAPNISNAFATLGLVLSVLRLLMEPHEVRISFGNASRSALLSLEPLLFLEPVSASALTLLASNVLKELSTLALLDCDTDAIFPESAPAGCATASLAVLFLNAAAATAERLTETSAMRRARSPSKLI